MRFRRLMKNHNDIILFLNYSFISNRRILQFIDENLLDNFLYLNNKSLIENQFLTDDEKDRLLESLKYLNIEQLKNQLYSYGIKYLNILENDYPQRLKNIFDPPAILYYRGNISMLKNPLAVIGSRKASDYGIWATNKLISELKGYDVSIVSGMALGIDRAAHMAAIDNNIFTAGVLASSIDIQYPKRNNDLYNLMKDNLLISEYPLNVEPLRRNFVIRNRIISGLSLGVIVVEANESSGSLITANFAIEQNKDVFGVPGNINLISSKGTNMLISKGAHIVTSGKDIIDKMPFIKEIDKISRLNLNKLQLSDIDLKVIDILKRGLFSIDEISNISQLKISQLYVTLTKLEMNYIIHKLPSGKFTL